MLLQDNLAKLSSHPTRLNHSTDDLGDQTLPTTTISPFASRSSSNEDDSEDDKTSSIGSSSEEGSPVSPSTRSRDMEHSKDEISEPIRLLAIQDPSPDPLVIPNKVSSSPAAKFANPKARKKGDKKKR